MASIRARIPERRLYLAPADAFFCHHMELEAEVAASGEAIGPSVELMLEGLSPFPLDQLHWGFVREPGGNRVLAFAVPHARLRKLGVDSLKPFVHAFPGFLSRFGESFPAPRVRFLAENGSVSALFHEAGQQVPAKIVSRRVRADILTDEALLATRNELAAAMAASDANATLEDGLWVGEGSRIEGERRLVFRHRHLTAEGPGEVEERSPPLDGDAVWEADIHDRSWKAGQRKERRQSRYVWLSTAVAAGFLIFLLLFQFGVWGLGFWNDRQARRIAEQQPKVMRINDTWALAARLTQSTEQDLAPFRMLEIINGVRPASVYFTRTRATAYNEIRIEGLSSAVAPVNAYADSLKRLPDVLSVENVFETRDGQTRFDLVVRFRDLPNASRAAREPEGDLAQATAADPAE